MFLIQHKWPSRWVGLCLLLTLAVGVAYRSHAQTRVIGAPHLPARTIDVLKNRHGYFPGQWRRWPGTPTARPKKTAPEKIPAPDPLPKKEKVRPTPPPVDKNPPFPLDRFDNDAPGRLPNTQPFPSGGGSFPPKGVTPLDLNSDHAPKPPDALKQPEPKPFDTLPPRNDPEEDSVPFGATPSLPYGHAAISPRDRYYQARHIPTTRPSRSDRPSSSWRYQPDRVRVFDPAARHAPQRTRFDSPAHRSGPQGRYDNPLRSGTRAAVSRAPQRAVPAANWSAADGRNAQRAEPIRSSVPPRFNPLRP